MKSSRRFTTAVVGILLALAGGCDLGAEPLEPGRYTYRASHPAPGGDESIILEGVLEIEEVEGDSVRGHWEVPQLHPELRVVGEEDGTVAVTAQPTYFGTIRHRISRTRRGISCSGTYVWVAEGGVERRVPLDCSITAGAEGVAPLLYPDETPMVRPIQGDTAGTG